MKKEGINSNAVTIINKLSDSEMKWFSEKLKKSGSSEKDIDMLNKMHAKRNERVATLEIKRNKNDLVDKLYSEEFRKLIFLANNNELISKLKGLKVLLHGKSGTGKTSFVESFIDKMSGNYSYEEIYFEKLISYKMGQTQNNLLKLLDSIIYKSKTQKMIVFIDEIDSIVVNREASNDIGEHSRVVASFLKFIDSMPQNVILVAATNVSGNLDQALLRRFNVKIEGRLASKNLMLETLSTTFKKEYSDRHFNKLFKDKDITFSISEINDFINSYEIEKAMDETIDLFAFFILSFQNKIKPNFEDFSVRVTKNIKKIGNNE